MMNTEINQVDQDPFIMSTKKANKVSCKSIYWNAIKLLNRSPIESMAAIQEIDQTSRCVNPKLDEVRKSYIEKMTQSRYNRVVRLTATDRDLVVANIVVLHYHHWTLKELVNSLPYHSQVYYYTLDRPLVQFGALMTMGGALATFLSPYAI